MAPPGDREKVAIESLVNDLLASAGQQDAAELAERVLALPPVEALAVVDALGRSRQEAAAPILVVLAERATAKEVRKEARRALHRLRAVGLAVPRPAARSASGWAPGAERKAELVEAWATAPDGVGSRALWMVAERPLGGVYAVAMVVNDMVGIKACSLDETTRKRYQQRLEEYRASLGLTSTTLPVDYARQLIGEALALNEESGFAVPAEVRQYERVVAEPHRPFEQALIYAEIRPQEVSMRPDYVEASPSLLEEPELEGWLFDYDTVRRHAGELRQARESRVILTEELKAERERQIIANAIRDAVTPSLQRGLRRRLEETAYVFLRTGRRHQATLAVAAARRLDEGALTMHPFLHALMRRSLELAIQAEGGQLPAELLRRDPYASVAR